MPADETQLLYSICLHGRSELGLAPDEYAALTMVLLRLLAFKPQSGKRAAAEKKTLIDTPARVATPLPQPVPVPVPVPAPAGQQLHVLSKPAALDRVQPDKEGLSGVEDVPSAIKIVAIPVRVQADS